LDLAFSNFTKAIELNPMYAQAYADRARIHRARGDRNQALKDINMAIRLNPKHANQ